MAPASSETSLASATARVKLPAAVDLHARPAADFVRAAMGFDAELWVASDEREVDAKSLLSILALGAKRGTELRLRGEGPDAGPAIEKLREIITALGE